MSRKPTSLATLVKYLHRHPHVELWHPGKTRAIPEPAWFDRRFKARKGKNLVFLTPTHEESDLFVGQPAVDLAFFDNRFEVSVYRTHTLRGAQEELRDQNKPPFMVLVYFYAPDGPVKLPAELVAEAEARLDAKEQLSHG